MKTNTVVKTIVKSNYYNKYHTKEVKARLITPKQLNLTDERFNSCKFYAYQQSKNDVPSDIHNDIQIIEGTSGSSVSFGKNLTEAIKEANDILERYGYDKVKEFIVKKKESVGIENNLND